MERNVEIDKPAIIQTENQAVTAQLLALFPGLLHERCTGHIKNLLLNIDLH